ncbi:hypothetical protein [Paludifilum halophilum]|uniref:Prolipoprotein diacylglyceryl transferase n=1 Tax=Paludifilum halophilum TaxID=1642702 RepID=A0A235B7Y4_9BACL|nr:hypothetical protein [Paludifilum halophilum]OYD08099.1 hypothetical protein CHM34_08285 [Paludifilum halophilum]
MFTQDVLPLGPFLLPLTWLVGGFSITVGGKVAEQWEAPVQRHVSWSEVWIQAALLWFFVWRWSPLLWNPATISEDPRALLFVSGTEKGAWLGGAVATGFLGWFLRKNQLGMARLLDAFIVAAVTAGIIYSFLLARLGETTSLFWGISPEGYSQTYHPIHLYRVAVLAAVWVWGWNLRLRLSPGQTFVRLGMVTGVSLLVVSYFDYYSTTLWLGLSGQQWIFVGLALSAWMAGFVPWLPREKEHLEREKPISPQKNHT